MILAALQLAGTLALQHREQVKQLQLRFSLVPSRPDLSNNLNIVPQTCHLTCYTTQNNRRCPAVHVPPTFPYKLVPMIANMKKNSDRTLPTFASAGSEYHRVWNSVRRPLALGMRRNILVTLKTLRSETAGKPWLVFSSTISAAKDSTTTAQSNLFQLSWRGIREVVCNALTLSSNEDGRETYLL